MLLLLMLLALVWKIEFFIKLLPILLLLFKIEAFEMLFTLFKSIELLAKVEGLRGLSMLLFSRLCCLLGEHLIMLGDLALLYEGPSLLYPANKEAVF